MIFHCLMSLAERNAYGLVENVFLFACPVDAESSDWSRLSRVVAGFFSSLFAHYFDLLVLTQK